jgi:hypothetical protein
LYKADKSLADAIIRTLECHEKSWVRSPIIEIDSDGNTPIIDVTDAGYHSISIVAAAKRVAGEHAPAVIALLIMTDQKVVVDWAMDVKRTIN